VFYNTISACNRENFQYQYPVYKQESNFSIAQPSFYSDDIQLSYFSSAKIMPIPEVNEDSPRDSQSMDSLKDELETPHEQNYVIRDINDGNFKFSHVTSSKGGLNRYTFQ